jgi:nucleotide-binding universal stress UspA family protein
VKIEKPEQGSNQLFERTVIAAAFSPRAQAVLNEAHYLVSLVGSKAIVVHVGERTPQNSSKLEKSIAESNFGSNPDLTLELRAGDPEEVLVQVAKDYRADLIIAGALPKETFFKYYMGSVARNLARNAPCSVLLYSEPQPEPIAFSKIHCAVEYHRGADIAVQLAARLACVTDVRDLYFTHAFHIAESTLKGKKVISPDDYKKMYSKQDVKLQTYLSKHVVDTITYHAQCMHEQDTSPSMAFTKDMGADLFIINGPKQQYGLWHRLFPNDLEQTLQDLPCSILIARRPSYTRHK